MKVFHKANDIHTWLRSEHLTHSIGFVPTMGALHAGHLSLIDRSKAENDLTVCSIFVNPTQFNDPNDLEKYPRTLTDDTDKLLQHNCDVLFLPTEEEIYPDPSIKARTYDLAGLEDRWEGANRPGHFQGVCMVVHRLLEIIPTDRLYLGQKDFQQFLILRHMVRHILHWPVQVIPCTIVREDDGLAMSSRNVRLSEQERQDSLVLHRALQYLQQHAGQQPLQELLQAAKSMVTSADSIQKLDYLAIVNPVDMAPVEDFDDAATLLAIVAAHLPSARLIDNQVIKGQLADW